VQTNVTNKDTGVQTSETNAITDLNVRFMQKVFKIHKHVSGIV